MLAIYKKEVRSYLTSMIGYVFMFFILVMTGIYFTAYNLQYAYPVFGITLNSVTFIFLIAVPILTMRVLAEEKKQKTDQMLLTAPVSVQDIIIGKFLALSTIYLIPMIIISLYPLIMSSFGDVSLPMAYTAVFGFLLLGLANIAVGMFLSSVTESQIIAAVLSFLILFACYMAGSISSFFESDALTSLIAFAVLIVIAAIVIYTMVKNTFMALIIGCVGEIILFVVYLIKSSLFEGAIQDFFDIFNINSHLNTFINGIFDLTGIIYFLSIVAVFLFLSMQSLIKRRWS
jgi:ABC-2 type transport system permease protein